jgi:hypothetical protein
MTQMRQSTGVHEAGHAVVSYVVGRRMMHAVLLNHQCGEFMPLCSACDTCVEYYNENDPARSTHSKLIQDNLRCDMAISTAGEIAQRAICGNGDFDEHDFEKDRSRARELSSKIHQWIDPNCWREWGATTCPSCKAYGDSITQAVSEIVAKQHIKDSIQAIAEELEKLNDNVRMNRSGIEEILKASGLMEGSEIGSLPSVG